MPAAASLPSRTDPPSRGVVEGAAKVASRGTFGRSPTFAAVGTPRPRLRGPSRRAGAVVVLRRAASRRRRVCGHGWTPRSGSITGSTSRFDTFAQLWPTGSAPRPNRAEYPEDGSGAGGGVRSRDRAGGPLPARAQLASWAGLTPNTTRPTPPCIRGRVRLQRRRLLGSPFSAATFVIGTRGSW